MVLAGVQHPLDGGGLVNQVQDSSLTWSRVLHKDKLHEPFNVMNYFGGIFYFFIEITGLVRPGLFCLTIKNK